MVFTILLKAFQFRNALSNIERVKKNAYRASIGLPPLHPWYQIPFRALYSVAKYIAIRTCCTCLRKKRGKLSAWDRLWTNGTFGNKILKSFLGFLSGIIATLFMMVFLLHQLNLRPVAAIPLSLFFGTFLSLGLAFSQKIRCIYFLIVPQFFTQKGRMAILAYTFVLAISGPGKNTANNMEVMTDSLICGQEMVKTSTADLIELATHPMSALKNAIQSIITSVKEVAKRIKGELRHFVKSIKIVVNAIKTAYKWLKSIVELCNTKVGTPFDRCWAGFADASDDCAYQLGSLLSWMCYVVDAFQNLCYSAKIVDALCWLPSLVKEVTFTPIAKHLKNFSDGFKTFFDVRLRFNHDFDHDLTMSKNFSQIARDMKAEVMGNIKWLTDYFDWTDFLVSGFLFLVFYKAIIYHSRYLNSDRHDNRFITNGLVRIDMERKRIGKDTIFPLKYRESKEYVQVLSLAMITSEWSKLKQSVILVTFSAIQILTYVFIDYLLYQFLELMRKHGAIYVDTGDLLGFNTKVTGEGFLSEMYRAILKAVSPIGEVMPKFDTTPCLPIGSEPDYLSYLIIVLLILLNYLAAVTEPYGLRLRHIVCGIYYPDRKVHRDRWLYTHILSSRGSFMKYARRQIKAKIKGDERSFRVSCMDRLSHTIPLCRKLNWFFGGIKKQCFLCGLKGDLDDYEAFIHCPNCNTVYCQDCFDDIEKKCTACLNPIDYGDFSDISEESGSDSEEEANRRILKKQYHVVKGGLNRQTLKRQTQLQTQSSPVQQFREAKYNSLPDSEYDSLPSSSVESDNDSKSSGNENKPLLSSNVSEKSKKGESSVIKRLSDKKNNKMLPVVKQSAIELHNKTLESVERRKSYTSSLISDGSSSMISAPKTKIITSLKQDSVDKIRKQRGNTNPKSPRRYSKQLQSRQDLPRTGLILKPLKSIQEFESDNADIDSSVSPKSLLFSSEIVSLPSPVISRHNQPNFEHNTIKEVEVQRQDPSKFKDHASEASIKVSNSTLRDNRNLTESETEEYDFSVNRSAEHLHSFTSNSNDEVKIIPPRKIISRRSPSQTTAISETAATFDQDSVQNLIAFEDDSDFSKKKVIDRTKYWLNRLDNYETEFGETSMSNKMVKKSRNFEGMISGNHNETNRPLVMQENFKPKRHIEALSSVPEELSARSLQNENVSSVENDYESINEYLHFYPQPEFSKEPKDTQEYAESEEFSEFEEEFDKSDEDGHCHHHSSAEAEVYNKYRSVISELNSTLVEIVEPEKVSSPSPSLLVRTDEQQSHKNNESSRSTCRNCIGQIDSDTESITEREIETDDNLDITDNASWLKNHSTETFRYSPVVDGIFRGANYLDTFYKGMPYPPQVHDKYRSVVSELTSTVMKSSDHRNKSTIPVISNKQPGVIRQSTSLPFKDMTRCRPCVGLGNQNAHYSEENRTEVESDEGEIAYVQFEEKAPRAKHSSVETFRYPPKQDETSKGTNYLDTFHKGMPYPSQVHDNYRSVISDLTSTLLKSDKKVQQSPPFLVPIDEQSSSKQNKVQSSFEPKEKVEDKHSPEKWKQDHLIKQNRVKKDVYFNRLSTKTFQHPPHRVAGGIRDRVHNLDKFYKGKPYPPNCNV